MSAAASGGAGSGSGSGSRPGAEAESGADAGWFGSSGRTTRRHAAPDAGETEALGARIGQDRDRRADGDHRAAPDGTVRTDGPAGVAPSTAAAGPARPRHAASDPMTRGRITWGQADRTGAEAGHPGRPGAATDQFAPRQPEQSAPHRGVPQQPGPNRTATPRPSAPEPSVPGPSTPSWSTPGPSAPGPSASARPGPDRDGLAPDSDPAGIGRTEILPTRPGPVAPPTAPIAPAATGGNGARDADRTDVLPYGARDADRTDVLPSVARDTDRTDVLPSVARDADRTDVLPSAARGDTDRTDLLPPATPATPATPDTGRTDVLPSVPPDVTASPTRVIPTAGPATAPLRDPWQEDPGADGDADADAGDHTHDPHEVTVQLDAVQLGDGVIRRADSGGHRKGKTRAEASDGPVFVDSSGRRTRLYRRLGILVGIACAVYAVVIVSTLLSGNSDAPWLPVPGQEEGKPAGQVDTTPLPSEPAQPSATGTATAPADPSAGTGVTTAPGSDAPAAGTSGATGTTTGQPGTSTGPESPAGGTDPNPGETGGTGENAPDPGQSSPQAPGSTDPSAPTGGGDATTDPTAPTGDPTGTDPGAGGTNANGVSDDSPVAGSAGGPVTVAEQSDPSTSLSLSPENTL
ncbi:hypothetical protein [Streptomyces mayonensis]|uniref:hypothetical protein n=1 Tax=Streptomyces mayonensis TaxID=2750816 RepID=UPI001C1DE216|nr:hypothetical protein [Streptomyces sp. A108]MBU6531999.1 hypothetical protein [Streptomyces sp. A108]